MNIDRQRQGRLDGLERGRQGGLRRAISYRAQSINWFAESRASAIMNVRRLRDPRRFANEIYYHLNVAINFGKNCLASLTRLVLGRELHRDRSGNVIIRVFPPPAIDQKD